MHEIIAIQPLGDFKFDLESADGTRGTVALSNLRGKGVFKLWDEPVAFEAVKIGSSGELVWHDRIDLCPGALCHRVTGKLPEEVFPHLRENPAHA